jgi:hypothetical protein
MAPSPGLGRPGRYPRRGPVRHDDLHRAAERQANNPWSLDVIVTTKATGASGKLDICGNFASWSGSSGAPWTSQGVLNATSSGTQTASQITIDLTAAYALGIFENLSVGGTGNSITTTHVMVEVLA